MPNLGDFTADGEFVYVEATDEKGVKTGKLRKERTNDLERERYSIRKGGYKPLDAQARVKPDPDGDTLYDFQWQTALGILEKRVGSVEFLGQRVTLHRLNDVLDSSALQGILRIPRNVYDADGNITAQGFEPSTESEFAFLMSADMFDDADTVITDPARDNGWVQFFMALTGDVNNRVGILFKPVHDHFLYEAPGGAFTQAGAEIRPKNFPLQDYANGFCIFSATNYLRRFEATRVQLPVTNEDGTIVTRDFYEIRIIAWLGHSGQALSFAFIPRSFEEGVNPKFVITTAANLYDIDPDVTLLGARDFSLLLVATGPSLVAERDLETVAKEVSTLRDTVVANAAVSDAAESELRRTAVALRKNDAVLYAWLSSLSMFNGVGIYAAQADIPDTSNVAVVRTTTGSTIFYRGADGKLKALSDYSDTAESAAAYTAAVTFVSGLKSAAGSPVDSTELNTIKADIDKVEADLLSLAKSAGREVAEVATYVVPDPVWPAGLANVTGGSLMVRRGQVTTVKTTLVNNNSFAGSFVIGQTFGTAERGKAMIARAAVKAADHTARIELAAQTFPDGGALGQATLAYVNDAWTVTGGTVTLDEGWAVLSFPVTFSANANTQILGGISPGDVQLLAIYEASKATYSKTATDLDVTDINTGTKIRFPLDIVSKVESNRAATVTNAASIAAVAAKVDATTPVTAAGGDTRADATPFITIPDRAGVRFDKLRFTFRDSRKNAAGGWDYASRTTVLEVPASWLDMGVVAGRTGWTAVAQTFDDPTSQTTPKATITRNSLFRTLSYGTANARADYDLWLNFRRNADSWDIWFQGQHITTDRKPLNQYSGVYDITASYVVDTSAVDPKLKPLTDRVTALEGKATPDLTAYAKKKDLAKKQGRVKLWSPEATDFAVTLGAIAEDTAPQFAGSADIEAKTFTVVPAAPGVRVATVRFTVPNLVIGQKYELAIEVGSGLVTGFALAGPTATTQDVTNWKKYSQIITATATTYAGSYTVTHGAVVHGPAIYSVPGLYVQDEALAAYQVAEPADVAAAEARANSVTNFLGQTVQGQGSRISALEARPTGIAPPNPQWFPAERDYGKAYLRRTQSGAQAQSISFDFVAAGSGNVPVSINLPTTGAPISGWPISGFWGVAAVFINITPPGGVAMTIYVGASIDGVVEIGVGAASGAPSASIGRVRNVVIDGIPADRLT